MKDFTGREINIGDDVIFFAKMYNNMMQGIVYNIGEKMVCVQFHDKEYRACSLTKPKTYKIYPDQCIICTSESIDATGIVTRVKRII